VSDIRGGRELGEVLGDVPSAVLAVYAHPDDAAIACGGALAKWAAAGCAVHLIVCTDGGKGTLDTSLTGNELVLQRSAELAASASAMGLASHRVLGAPDGELEERSTLREEIVGAVREIRPDAVVGHDPTAVFFGREYVNHRDHRAAGWAMLDAVAPASALPLYFPHAGPPHQVSQAFLTGTLEPDVWIDITAFVEQKIEAVGCHGSQFSDGEGVWARDAVRRRAAEEGRRAGVAFAEGFRLLHVGEVAG
jgi:LmbE family N-acetylglucosaminyl deacetylase